VTPGRALSCPSPSTRHPSGDRDGSTAAVLAAIVSLRERSAEAAGLVDDRWSPKDRVRVGGDGEATLQDVVWLLHLVRQAGYPSTCLATGRSILVEPEAGWLFDREKFEDGLAQWIPPRTLVADLPELILLLDRDTRWQEFLPLFHGMGNIWRVSLGCVRKDGSLGKLEAFSELGA
jgi:hypothetical protein